jgi:hypothetical protein
MIKTTDQTEALLENDYIHYVRTTVNDDIKVITFEIDEDVDVQIFERSYKVISYDELWIDDEFKGFRINYIDKFFIKDEMEKFFIKDEDEFVKRIKVSRDLINI